MMRLASALVALCMAQAAHAQMMPMGGDAEQPRDGNMANAEMLTDETFEERRMDSAHLLVFYRSGSDHQATQHDKEIELAASELASTEDDAITIGIVDTDEHKSAAKAANLKPGKIRPTLEFFQRGKHMPDIKPYGGDARSIVNFMRIMAGPVSKELTSSDDLNKWLKQSGSTVVLGIFSDRTRPSHNQWIKSAEKLRPRFRFIECTMEVAKAAKLFSKANPAAEALDETKNQFAVVRPQRWLGKGEEPFYLSTDFPGMGDIVKTFAETKVAPMSSATQALWKSQGRAMVMVIFDTDKLDKMFKYIVNRIHKLIDADPTLLKGFAFTIANRKSMASSFDTFGLNASADFAVAVINTTNTRYWGIDALTNLTVDTFSAMPLLPALKRIAAGEEPPYIRSEDPPAAGAEGTAPAPGRVGKVVGTTYTAVADDESLDVLLVLFGQEFPPPSLAEAASLLESMPSVRVVAMNTTSNYVNTSRFEAFRQGATQIFFAAASAKGKAEYVEYTEDTRQLDAIKLARFVLKHAVGDAPSGTRDAARAAISKKAKELKKQQEEQFPGIADMMQQQREATGDDAASARKRRRRKKKTAKGREKAEL